VDTLLSEQQVLEDRKQALIDDLLKQREAAMATFDEQLAKLGYQANSVKPRSSHHERPATAAPNGPQSSMVKAKPEGE
jgi:uncharacterized membrane protein YGL010W